MNDTNLENAVFTAMTKQEFIRKFRDVGFGRDFLRRTIWKAIVEKRGCSVKEAKDTHIIFEREVKYLHEIEQNCL